MLDDVMLTHLTVLASVVMIDIVLAGDNAIVVGLAAAGLPTEQRRRAIAIGIMVALICRILFAVVAQQLLAIIGLLLAGGLLLLWVAWKMWRELRELHRNGSATDGEALTPFAGQPKKFKDAVVQIAIADVSMSLDNVLAVAGAANEHTMIMVFGLVLSIALMGFAAHYIASILVRYHWLSYIGLVVIAYVALAMIYDGGNDVLTTLSVI